MSKNQEDPKDQVIQGLYNQDYDSSESEEDNIPIRKKKKQLSQRKDRPKKRQKKETKINKKKDIIKANADEEQSYHTSEMSSLDENNSNDSDQSNESEIVETKQQYREDKNQKKKKRLRKRNMESLARELIDEEAQDSDEEHHQNYKNRKEEDKYIEYIKRQKRTEYIPNFNTYDDRLNEYEKEKNEEEYEEQKQNLIERKPKITTSKQLQTDPKIFMIGCVIRFERSLATQLMIKYADMKNQNKPVKFISAIAIDKMPGFIFIEAYTKQDVLEAIDGLLHINKLKIKLIPSSEVDQILQPNPKNEIELKLKQFVKIKRGLYHDDYAQIQRIDLDSKQVELKLIPRIGPYVKSITGEIQNRPAQKFFNAKDFNQNEITRSKSHNLFLFRKEKYNSHGFLIKNFKMSNIVPTKTVPPLQVVQSFNRDNRKFERQNVMRNLQDQRQNHNNIYNYLRQGDMVKIKDGQHIGKKGKILDCDENQQIVRIILLQYNQVTQKFEESPQPQIFRVFEFEKIFQIGDHVEVISGDNQGESGIIIKTDDNKAEIVTDGSNKLLITFVNNLARVQRRKFQQQQNIKQQKKKFIQKYDLVKMNDQKTIGVVLSIKNNIVTLIDTEGATKKTDLIDIENKITKKSFLKNNHDQIIEPKTVVKVLRGRERDLNASVLHVYRDRLFLNASQQGRYNKIKVVDGNDCFVLQSSEVHNPNIQARFNNLEQKQETDDNSRKRENPNQQMVRLIGQKRKIMQGKWKGYEGVIKQVNETRANFELSAVSKILIFLLKKNRQYKIIE